MTWAGDPASLSTLGWVVPWLCTLCGVWPCVMGPLCLLQELLQRGCVFQERQGWERPGWFNPKETAPVSDDAWALVHVTGRPWASHTLPHLSILPATQIRPIRCASGCGARSVICTQETEYQPGRGLSAPQHLQRLCSQCACKWPGFPGPGGQAPDTSTDPQCGQSGEPLVLG